VNNRKNIGISAIAGVIYIGISLLAVSCAEPPLVTCSPPYTESSIGYKEAGMTQIATRPIPAIDAGAPLRVETATFSLG